MKFVLTALGASLILAGCAAGPKAEEHAAHHPPGAANAAPAAPASPSSGQMDSMMKSMQAMHDKLMAAKSPEERAALMKDHMKLMHDGMAMMGHMRGGMGAMGNGMPMSPETMGKRMDMMEMMMQMMMQMMMDREATQPPAAK